MKRLLLAAAANIMLMSAARAAPSTVAVSGGTVAGNTADDRLLFRGIPYAAPPVGKLRWRPPAPVQPWPGVLDSVRRAAACPQNDYGWNRFDHVHASEDCLTLDVGTPALGGRLPVLVWIHGGSNRAGSPGDMITSPMVRRGIVIVAIRYRLGLLGFLAHRGAADEAGGAAGNYGLMDQIAALRWVRDNISRFGGDPSRVTIAGESAGAQDVGLLLAAPEARGLFAQAILESGTPDFGLPPRPLEDALRIGDQLDAALGTSGIGELRVASLDSLLAADRKLHDALLTADDYLWLRPTLDGGVLPDTPARLLAAAPQRPVLLGTNRFELDLPGGHPARDAFVATAWGTQEDAARRFYRLDRPDPPADPRQGARDQQIATDATFRCPAEHLAEQLSSSGAPVWRYEFDGPAVSGGMTAHAAELPYVFGDKPLSGLDLGASWAAFVRSGSPQGPGLPRWPRYDQHKSFVEFTADGTISGSGLRAEICGLSDTL